MNRAWSYADSFENKNKTRSVCFGFAGFPKRARRRQPPGFALTLPDLPLGLAAGNPPLQLDWIS